MMFLAEKLRNNNRSIAICAKISILSNGSTLVMNSLQFISPNTPAGMSISVKNPVSADVPSIVVDSVVVVFTSSSDLGLAILLPDNELFSVPDLDIDLRLYTSDSLPELFGSIVPDF